jgi:hypothetical protein
MNHDWIKAMREAADEALAPVKAGECGCHHCIRERGHIPWHMVVCSTCGNKRCPHANDHRNACTNSNEPGQPGSAY